MDGSPNQAGGITSVVNMVADYKEYTKHSIQLTVTWLRKQHVILGYSWLQKHNLEINWGTKGVHMTHCLTGCCTCWDELQVVWRNEKLATSVLRQLCEGQTLSICAVNSEEWHGDNGYNPADDDDLPDLSLDSDNDDEDELEEGDHILYTVFTPVEEIHAGSTISQHLAEAYTQNSTLAGTEVLSGPRISRMSSTGSLSTLCRKGGQGTMPSSLSWIRSQPTPDLSAQTEGA
jgi:hypothetical protein